MTSIETQIKAAQKCPVCDIPLACSHQVQVLRFSTVSDINEKTLESNTPKDAQEITIEEAKLQLIKTKNCLRESGIANKFLITKVKKYKAVAEELTAAATTGSTSSG